eukprot:5456537-Pyramimonas_sp.AAC.1
MKTSQVDTPLQEGCRAGGELGQAPLEASGRLRAARRTSRGHRAPAPPPSQPPLAGRHWQGNIFVDCFAGSGA